MLRVGIAFPNGDRSQNILFENIAKSNADHWSSVNTGQEMLEFLADRSCSSCRIKVLTIAGHGWRYRRLSTGGPGIPGVGNNVGFYSNSVGGINLGSANISDLKKMISSKKIRFDKECTIQIHSCRISVSFSTELAKASKCTVIAAGSSCFPSHENPDTWQSAPGSWEEKNNSSYTGFYKIVSEPAQNDSFFSQIMSFLGLDKTDIKKYEIGNNYDPQIISHSANCDCEYDEAPDFIPTVAL